MRQRKKLCSSLFIALVLVISLLPITLLIPEVPEVVAKAARILPNGLAATISVGLVSGTSGTIAYLVDLLLLFGWLVGFLILCVRLSRGHFYAVLECFVP